METTSTLGECVRDVFAIYDNNISPSLLMIIIKIILLYFIQIRHTDDFLPTGTPASRPYIINRRCRGNNITDNVSHALLKHVLYKALYSGLVVLYQIMKYLHN